MDNNYVKQMRLALCKTELIHSDGSLNHEYFMQRKGAFWGTKQTLALKKQLLQKGIGNWQEMKQDKDLESFYWQELEIRTQYMLALPTIRSLKRELTQEEINKIQNY
jgi:hypothetical protein